MSAHHHENWQLLDNTQGGKYCGACGQQVTTQETTKENTMTEIKKNFKSISATGRVLEVLDTEGLLRLKIQDNYDNTRLMVNLNKEEAPAIALAILLGAGIVPVFQGVVVRGTNKHLRAIAQALSEYVEATDAEAKAKKEQEELLAKKLDGGRRLYNADRSACDLVWEDLSSASQNVWSKRMEDATKIIERMNATLEGN